MIKSNHRGFGIDISINNESPDMIVGSEGGSILCRFTTFHFYSKVEEVCIGFEIVQQAYWCSTRRQNLLNGTSTTRLV